MYWAEVKSSPTLFLSMDEYLADMDKFKMPCSNVLEIVLM